ncbi:MAG TPA: SOS response-associated peptidase [Tepidisphaeraceae bacterium]|nr:SOS response-associated peptidase [Tepidisphaeraceae bacterium]
MCGRYTLIRLADVLEKFPWIEHAPPDLVPRYNIAPTQPLLAIANDHPAEFTHFYWGLVPSWAKDISVGHKMINARAETLPEKPSYRTALRRRRCLIPADGFYEWQVDPATAHKSRPTKQPVWIRMKDHKPFAFAGLWEHWHDHQGAGNELRSCTVITTSPNELMRPIHDRMPVIVPPELYQEWLSKDEREPDELMAMLGPYPADQMEATPVSTFVNSPKNEGPGCVEGMTRETLW